MAEVEAGRRSIRRGIGRHRLLLAAVAMVLVAGGWWGWREWREDDCFDGELRVERTYGPQTRMIIYGEETTVGGGPTLRFFDDDGNPVDVFGCPFDDASAG